MEDLNALLRRVRQTTPDVDDLLQQVHGWRGVFDPYCHEYQQTTVRVKANFLNVLLKYVSFGAIIDLYRATEKREYILQDLPVAIKNLAHHLIEAEEYIPGGT